MIIKLISSVNQSIKLNNSSNLFVRTERRLLSDRKSFYLLFILLSTLLIFSTLPNVYIICTSSSDNNYNNNSNNKPSSISIKPSSSSSNIKPFHFPIFTEGQTYHTNGTWKTIEGYFPVYNEQILSNPVIKLPRQQQYNNPQHLPQGLLRFNFKRKVEGILNDIYKLDELLNHEADPTIIQQSEDVEDSLVHVVTDSNNGDTNDEEINNNNHGSLSYTLNKKKGGVVKNELIFKQTILKEYYFVYGIVNLRNGKYFLLHRENVLFLEGVYSIYENRFYFLLKPKKYLFHPLPVNIQRNLITNLFLNDTGAEMAYYSYLDNYMDELKDLGLRYDTASSNKENNIDFNGNSNKMKVEYKREYKFDLNLFKTSNHRESCIYLGYGIGKLRDINWYVNGIMSSVNCNHTIVFSENFHDNVNFLSELNTFLQFGTFFTILQVIGLFRQMKSTRTRSLASKVSILFVGFTSTLSFITFSTSLAFLLNFYEVFNSAIALSIMSFIALACSIQYMLFIWRSQYPDQYETVASASVHMRKLFFFFWGFSMMILFGGYYLLHVHPNYIKYLLYFLLSYLVPQIFVNILYNTKKSLDLFYTFIITLQYVSVVYYFCMRENNFLEFPLDYTLCFWLGSYVWLQFIILLLQHYIDPRFKFKLFNCLLPPKYNYHRPIPMNLLEEGECKCVICMHEIELPKKEKDDENTLLDNNNYTSTDIMVTPCNHCFHTICLERWREYKNECPLCKKELPIS
ncbi:hypothetical protein ABK040_002394 [Willaertia magna]